MARQTTPDAEKTEQAPSDEKDGAVESPEVATESAVKETSARPTDGATPSTTAPGAPVSTGPAKRGHKPGARCSRGHIKHRADGTVIRVHHPDAAAECDACAKGKAPRAVRAPIPGIDTESSADRAAREQRETEAATAKAVAEFKAKRKAFVESAKLCKGLIGDPLAKLAVLGLQNRGLETEGVTCMVVVTTEDALEMRENVPLDKALAHGLSEILAMYAPAILGHPLMPAIATLSLCALASAQATQERRMRPRARKADVKVENGAAQATS